MQKNQKNPRGTIIPVAGDRQSVRLINAVQSAFVEYVLTGTLTIAGGAADLIKSRGSIMAAYDEMGVNENGTDRAIMHGRVLRVLSEVSSERTIVPTRVTSTAAAAYPLRETVRLYFANPQSAVPRETAFLEHDTRQALEAFVKLAASGGADKLVKVSGAVTAVLSNLKVAVTHGFDAQESDRPYFIPTVRQQTAAVAGAQSALPVFIKTANSIRGMVVSTEDSIIGEVSDVVNALALRGDFRDIIGPATRKWLDLVDAQQHEFGGDMTSAAHVYLNFQTHGRLAAVLNPNQDNNLRFEFDCQPTAAAGAGTTQIRITTIELVSDPALCKPLDIPV